MKINKNIIKELNDYLDEFNLTEIEYTEKDVKVKVSKSRISKNIETIIPDKEDKIIKKGDTVMIVEAMKTMNHVPSPTDGIVKEITVEDGQPVEFGQTIATIV